MSDAGAVPEVIIERKFKPDGTVREYACELVSRSDGVLVVRFRTPEGGTHFEAPVDVPPGSLSYGWFWPRRPYNLYRMFGPDGALVAHRFDAAAGVKILEGAVEYRDLVLDWWVLPDGSVVEEDRDELEALAERGVLTPAAVAAANAAAHEVLSRYRHIIEGVGVQERKLGILRGPSG